MKAKKILLIAAIVAGGLFLVGGIGAVRKGIEHAKIHFGNWVDENTSPEDEIARLKAEVAKLDAEENGIKNDLAKEIAACEKLDKETKALDASVEADRKTLCAFGESIKDAEKDNKKVSVGKGVTMDVDQAKKKLVSDRDAFLKREAALATRKNTLQTREESKKVLFDQLNEIQAVRNDLNAELDKLDAEYKALKLDGMKNKNHRDSSKLSEIRADIEKLKDKAAERRARNSLDTGKAKAADTPVTDSVDDILAPAVGK